MYNSQLKNRTYWLRVALFSVVMIANHNCAQAQNPEPAITNADILKVWNYLKSAKPIDTATWNRATSEAIRNNGHACISGDCQNGHGISCEIIDGYIYQYEGTFSNGKNGSNMYIYTTPKGIVSATIGDVRITKRDFLSIMDRPSGYGFTLEQITYFQNLAFAGLYKCNNCLVPTDKHAIYSSHLGFEFTPSSDLYARQFGIGTTDLAIKSDVRYTKGLRNSTKKYLYIRAFIKKRRYTDEYAAKNHLNNPTAFYDSSFLLGTDETMGEATFYSNPTDKGDKEYTGYVGQYTSNSSFYEYDSTDVGDLLYSASGDYNFGHYEKAFSKYRQAALEGSAEAQYNVGAMYYHGEGVSQDYKQAFQWFQKAAEQNDPDAQFNLGHMYEEGIHVTKNMQQAIQFYKKAAAQDDAHAQAALKKLGEPLPITKPKPESKELVQLRQAAEQGDAKEQNRLGVSYYWGYNGLTRDYTQAFQWFKRAGEQGVAGAQYMVGEMYLDGGSGVKDTLQAIQWYNKAATQGYSNAARRLVDLGVKPPKDTSHNRILELLSSGTGNIRTTSTGNSTTAPATSQNTANSNTTPTGSNTSSGMVSQANTYYYNKQYSQAIPLYTQAAGQGNADAQYNLGVMYENGFGVPQNTNQATEWYKKSAAQGNTPALTALKRLNVTIQQTGEAQKIIKQLKTGGIKLKVNLPKF
ncbi:MAG: SEL1-like repeat protein [Chitinophagaceae bacterium]|jgi:TPR repeat protein|nr:SEL1-like repeat protein [Chitinophagaceae bacterium]